MIFTLSFFVCLQWANIICRINTYRYHGRPSHTPSSKDQNFSGCLGNRCRSRSRSRPWCHASFISIRLASSNHGTTPTQIPRCCRCSNWSSWPATNSSSDMWGNYASGGIRIKRASNGLELEDIASFHLCTAIYIIRYSARSSTL
jgi:hypothetical protein